MKVEPYENSKKLKVDQIQLNLRRDLHVFVAYVSEHDLKRSHRGNGLQKTDARRLAKLMSDPQADEEVAEDGYSTWLDFVDGVAHELAFVSYDTEGTYVGYSSQEPSFPDNFIRFNAKEYNGFLAQPLAGQEMHLLGILLARGEGSGSEFFARAILSQLDRFESFGSATGVIPALEFAKSRRFLLELLAELPTDQWLSTASLVEHLKSQHPYFLIPEKPKFKYENDKGNGRYANLREGERYKRGHDDVIKSSDKDSFERVEGRYVERFLEGIPKLLGYVEVGYAKPTVVQTPTLGGLPAFRVSQRLKRVLDGSLAQPTVRVTPSFEVYVQSELHPAFVLTQLARLSELVSEDTATVFRLKKQQVAAACAADSKLDPIRLLESLATTPLPENVRRELKDWTQHGEKFVLYRGFSLLETERDVPAPDKQLVETIEPGIYIVRSSKKVFADLEQRERMPLKVNHAETSFASLPEGACSALGTKRSPKKNKTPVTKPQVSLMKVTRVQLLCPDREFLQRLQSVLLGAGCPVEADSKNLSLVYAIRHDAEVGKAIRGLKNEYQVSIEDKG